MDVNVSSIVPDSWISRILDILGGIMLFVLKGAHSDFREQEQTVRKLVTEHEVFKANISNLTEKVDEVKEGTDKIYDLLLRKHK